MAQPDADAAAQCDQCGEPIDPWKLVTLLRCMHTVCLPCQGKVAIDGGDAQGTVKRWRCSVAGCGTLSAALERTVWLPAHRAFVASADRRLCDNTRCRAGSGGGRAPASHHCGQCIKKNDATTLRISTVGHIRGKDLCAQCTANHEQSDDYIGHGLTELTPKMFGRSVHGLCTLGCNSVTGWADAHCTLCGAAGCAACIAAHAAGGHAGSIVRLCSDDALSKVKAQLIFCSQRKAKLCTLFDKYEDEIKAARLPFERAEQHVEQLRRQLVTLVNATISEELDKIRQLTPDDPPGHEELTRLRAHVDKVADRMGQVRSAEYASMRRAPLRIFVSGFGHKQLDTLQCKADKMPRPLANASVCHSELIDERRVAAIVSKVRGALDLPSAAAAAVGAAAAAAVDKLSVIEPGELMQESPPPQAAHVSMPPRSGSKRSASSDTHSESENSVPQAKRQTNDPQSCLVCGSVPAEAVRFTCKAAGLCPARMAHAEKRWPASQYYCYGCHVPAIASADQIPASGLCSVCNEEKWTKDKDAAAANAAFLLLLIRSEAVRAEPDRVPAVKLAGVLALGRCKMRFAWGNGTMAGVKRAALALGMSDSALDTPTW